MTSKPDTDEPEFAALMQGVKPLDSDRINPYRGRPVNRTRPLIDQSAPTTDFSDIGFDQLSESAESWFDHGIQRRLQRRIRQGAMPIAASLDLHGCTQKDAYRELADFFDTARQAGDRTVIVIHGKGQRSNRNAVLKPLVHRWLSQQAFVLAWCPAQATHGGSGASYVYLR